MTEHQQVLLEKAQRNVGVAKRLIDEGEWDVAVSRAYYAMFYAAQACLYGLGLEYSKHSAVIAAFGREFAKTEILPRQLHIHLVQAEQARIQSDYEVAEPVPEAEAACFRNAPRSLSRRFNSFSQAEPRIGLLLERNA